MPTPHPRGLEILLPALAIFLSVLNSEGSLVGSGLGTSGPLELVPALSGSDQGSAGQSGNAPGAAEPPEIDSVEVSPSDEGYELQIRGSGFGQSPLASMPVWTTTRFLRAEVPSQLGSAEYFFGDDAHLGYYIEWTPALIEVSGLYAEPNDSVQVVVWSTQSLLGASWGGTISNRSAGWPRIDAVYADWVTGGVLSLEINGTSFGNTPTELPETGDTNFLQVVDFAHQPSGGSGAFSCGFAEWGIHSPDDCTLSITAWNPAQINVSWNRSVNGPTSGAFAPGDPLAILVWETNSTSPSGPQAAAGGRVPGPPAPGQTRYDSGSPCWGCSFLQGLEVPSAWAIGGVVALAFAAIAWAARRSIRRNRANPRRRLPADNEEWKRIYAGPRARGNGRIDPPWRQGPVHAVLAAAEALQPHLASQSPEHRRAIRITRR